MKRITSLTTILLALSSAALLAQTPATPAQPTEQQGLTAVRIVRLSLARGAVQIDRNTGQGFEDAVPNLPIIQGAKIRTTDGVAEIEFEDSSALRLATGTTVEFSQLQRNSTGATINEIKVLKGMVYAELEKTRGNIFILICDRGRIVVPPSSHIRFAVSGPNAQLAVLQGTAQFQVGTVVTSVPKKSTLLFTTAAETTPTLVSTIQDESADPWDKAESDFHKHHANTNALAGSNNLYGLSDLNYYGSFANLPGCGRVWRPYFTSAAWDPYATGLWAWYPDAGYTWVSPYPWGWAPFHYGSWTQCSSGGWGWQPGGDWVGLGNTGGRHHDHDGDHDKDHRHHHPYPPGTGHPPLPPIHPPLPGRTTMVVVNTQPLTLSRFDQRTESFVFRQDSAGLGIPREAFGKLGKTSEMTQQHGTFRIPANSVSRPQPGNEAGRGYGPNPHHEDRNDGYARNTSSQHQPDRQGTSSQNTWRNGGDRGSNQASAPSHQAPSGGWSGNSNSNAGASHSYSPPPSAPASSPAPSAPASSPASAPAAAHK